MCVAIARPLHQTRVATSERGNPSYIHIQPPMHCAKTISTIVIVHTPYMFAQYNTRFLNILLKQAHKFVEYTSWSTPITQRTVFH